MIRNFVNIGLSPILTFSVDRLYDICNIRFMADEKFFLHPVHDWQKRYEALRASFVERLPAKVIADRFGYSPQYVHLLRHQFKHGKIDFSEPVPEGKTKRRVTSAEVREKIRNWRQRNLSAGEIAQLLSEEGVELSVRTVERVLAEEGFPRLPRRTRIKLGITVCGAKIPAVSETVNIGQMQSCRFESQAAGVYLFAPFMERLGFAKIVEDAGLPGTKMIPATSYLLSFLALKLLGTERYAHAPDHAFDPGLGLFAGLNVLPKCTAMSTYSYGLSATQVHRLQKTFVQQVHKLGYYDESIINLDFHTIPHFGDESVLQKHWAGARNKTMKGALTLMAQDAESKLILYTAADIHRDEADDQVLEFLAYWNKINRKVKPTLVFDSRFTTYEKLSALNVQDIRFITLRRRGKKLVEQVKDLKPWTKIHLDTINRKYPNPLVHESTISLNGYEGLVRQVIVKGNGREKPTFLITNDFDCPLELLVGNYSRRWRVENAIAEAVKFFSLNALSSPILVKVHFDVVMTMIADSLYTMLAQKLRGFEECDAPKIFRSFVRGRGVVKVQGQSLSVTYPKRAHNPVLRSVPWHLLPSRLSWLEGIELNLAFE
jgi:transposase